MGTAKRERQKQNRQARLAQAQAAAERKKRFKVVRNFGILAAILVAIGAYVAISGGDDEVATGSPSTTVPTDGTGTTAGGTPTTVVPGEVPPFAYGEGACPAADGSSEPTLAFDSPPQLCIDPAKSYTATFHTTEGDVTVALDTAATPGTTNNFVVLSRYHYYDGTDLFRTDPSIGIIQGGSPTTQSASDPGPGYDLLDEGFDFNAIGGVGGPYSYGAGDLVMARSSAPNGAGAQFFFCVTDDCANLDGQGVYVEFGRVTEGLDVLEAILALHEPGSSLGGAPSRQVTIESVEIAEA